MAIAVMRIKVVPSIMIRIRQHRLQRQIGKLNFNFCLLDYQRIGWDLSLDLNLDLETATARRSITKNYWCLKALPTSGVARRSIVDKEHEPIGIHGAKQRDMHGHKHS